jgi:hypothetical protein
VKLRLHCNCLAAGSTPQLTPPLATLPTGRGGICQPLQAPQGRSCGLWCVVYHLWARIHVIRGAVQQPVGRDAGGAGTPASQRTSAALPQSPLAYAPPPCPRPTGKECFASPPPGARKTLGRFFTPQGKGAAAAQAGGPAAPATPGGEPRASKTEARPRDVFEAKGRAAEASLTTAGADPLPPQLASLRDLLGACHGQGRGPPWRARASRLPPGPAAARVMGVTACLQPA